MSYKGKGRQVNRTTLAEIFGISTNTVDAWVRSGCPIVQRGSRGSEWIFNTGDVRTWRESLVSADAPDSELADIYELKRRKLGADATMAELELAKAKGEVALISEFERAQSAIMVAIRTNIMNVPERAVLQLLGETDEIVFKQKLRAELTLALHSAADAVLDAADAVLDGDDAILDIAESNLSA